MKAPTLTLGTLEVSSVRVREGGICLGLFLLTLLITSSVADTQRGGTVAIDGVALGARELQVESLLGRSVARGKLADSEGPGVVWQQFCSRTSGETTVTFAADGSCVRVKGNSLSLGQKTRLQLGTSKSRVLSVLGKPLKAQSRNGREVLEFETAGHSAVFMVVEDGALVQISAAVGQRDCCRG